MTGHIFIEGEIGTKVTTESVRNDISLYPHATEFIVHINSEGGDVYEGYNIAHIISSLGKKTIAQIGALCASIATKVAGSCDRRVMGSVGDFMIHLPTGTLSGNAEDLRKGAAQLDRIKSELIAGYLPLVAKKGVSKEELSQMIDSETSMSPQEALEKGFIDEIQEKMKAVAKIDFKKYNMENNEDVKGALTKFAEKLDKFFDRMKVKNVSLTLEDGSLINSTAEDPNAIVGSTLTDEQGQPLKPGTHKTADGLSLVVTEGGKCESAEAAVEDKDSKMKQLEEENKALKEQIAKSDTKVAEQAKEVAAVAKGLKEFKNQADELKALKAEFEKIKNETFGDTTVVTDAPDKTQVTKKQEDPMLDVMSKQLGRAYTTSRNFN